MQKGLRIEVIILILEKKKDLKTKIVNSLDKILFNFLSNLNFTPPQQRIKEQHQDG